MLPSTTHREQSDLTSIGDILERMVVVADAPLPEAPEPMTPQQRREYLEMLTHLPASPVVQEQLATAETELAAAKSQGRSRTVAQAQRRLDLARHRWELCQERDQLQSARPEGCWCLGVGASGGETLRVLRQPTPWGAQQEPPIEAMALGFEWYCVCEAGQALHTDLMRRLQEDKADRLDRGIRLQWQTSGIPARFLDLRLSSHPLAVREPALIAALQGCDLAASWYLVGKHSTGKTGLATGYAWEWLQRRGGGTLIFRTVPELLDELKAAFNRREKPDERPAAVLDDYLAADLLILDDIGKEQATGWVQERLLRIIGGRHDWMKPIVFTSELPISAIAERLGPAIADRIIEMTGPQGYIEIQGPNLRGR